MTIEPETYSHRKPLFFEASKQHRGRMLFPKKVSAGIYHFKRDEIADICGVKGCIFTGGYLGTPMCEDHAWDVWSKLDRERGYAQQRELIRTENAAWDEIERQAEKKRIAELAASWKPERYIAPGWIYYLLVGDLVKIGYTTNLFQRMKQYPPNAQLLATHPGTVKTERQMHSKFWNSLSTGREWFTPTADLIEHIKEAHEKFPQEDLADLEVVNSLAA